MYLSSSNGMASILTNTSPCSKANRVCALCAGSPLIQGPAYTFITCTGSRDNGQHWAQYGPFCATHATLVKATLVQCYREVAGVV